MPLMPGAVLLDRLKSGERLLSDGAMGSELIRQGISPDDILSANLNDPGLVRSVHQGYLSAGSDLLTSNTFGLRDGRCWAECIAAGVAAAISCARDCDREIGVLCSLIPSVMPIELDFLLRLAQSGLHWSDAVLLETCTSLRGALEATEAARKLNSGLLAVTCHFTAEGFMLDGTSPEEAAQALVRAGADVVGANCGDGPPGFVSVARRMRNAVEVPLLMQPNAGLPEPGTTPAAYKVTPDQFASVACQLYDCGVSIVGGCCGTTPAHILATRRSL